MLYEGNTALKSLSKRGTLLDGQRTRVERAAADGRTTAKTREMWAETAA